jgi:hypothetical protein
MDAVTPLGAILDSGAASVARANRHRDRLRAVEVANSGAICHRLATGVRARRAQEATEVCGTPLPLAVAGSSTAADPATTNAALRLVAWHDGAEIRAVEYNARTITFNSPLHPPA